MVRVLNPCQSNVIFMQTADQMTDEAQSIVFHTEEGCKPRGIRGISGMGSKNKRFQMELEYH